MTFKMLLYAQILVLGLSFMANADISLNSAPGDDFSSALPYDHLVDVGDFYFSPETLHVQPGQMVRWQNVALSMNHTSTATGGYWDSGNLAPGEFYEFTFDSVGSFDYICSYHPVSMTGLIVVDAPVITPIDIQIVDFSFQPQNATVNLGDSVRWTNYDPTPHTSTSDDGLWDSGTLATGASFTYHTDTVGVFGYHCMIHHGMLGTLTVLDTIAGSTYEYIPGDANMLLGVWPPMVIGSDVTYLVNYFRGIGDACLLDGFYAAADVNGDCRVIGSDVTLLVNYFRGISTISHCPDYPPSWVAPPVDPPSGWPNCQ